MLFPPASTYLTDRPPEDFPKAIQFCSPPTRFYRGFFAPPPVPTAPSTCLCFVFKEVEERTALTCGACRVIISTFDSCRSPVGRCEIYFSSCETNSWSRTLWSEIASRVLFFRSATLLCFVYFVSFVASDQTLPYRVLVIEILSVEREIQSFSFKDAFVFCFLSLALSPFSFSQYSM